MHAASCTATSSPATSCACDGTQTVKVTDFGIAHVETAGKEQRTRVGDVLGTPQYMSPEQARGEKLDGRSDLFSTGIVLYQMLTGQRPFVGDSLVALAVKIAKEEPHADRQVASRRAGRAAARGRALPGQVAGAPLPDRQGAVRRAVAVLAEIDEAALEKNKPRIVPLRVKWAATMALIVAVVMGMAGTVITQRQQAALMDQVIDNGAALARFIAAQNAASALARRVGGGRRVGAGDHEDRRLREHHRDRPVGHRACRQPAGSEGQAVPGAAGPGSRTAPGRAGGDALPGTG